MDIETLKIKPILRRISLANHVATTSITVDRVTLIQIQSTSFLKYISVLLKDKTQIMNFYKNLVTQATTYNIFLTPAESITHTLGVAPDRMRPKSRSILQISNQFSNERLITDPAGHKWIHTSYFNARMFQNASEYILNISLQYKLYILLTAC